MSTRTMISTDEVDERGVPVPGTWVGVEVVTERCPLTCIGTVSTIYSLTARPRRLPCSHCGC